MIERINIDSEDGLPPKAWYIVSCPHDRDWSLWRGTPKHDVQRIDWEGDVVNKREPKSWDSIGVFRFYRVSQDVADRCFMAASLLDKQGWYAFAKESTVKEIDRC